jgi:chromosome segregation ATPase
MTRDIAPSEQLPEDLGAYRQAIRHLMEQISNRNEHLSLARADRERLSRQLAEGEQAAQALSAQIAEREQQAQALKAQLAEREQQAQALKAQVADREQQAQALKAQVAESEAQVQTLTSRLTDKDQAVLALTAELAAITRSRGWRLVLLVRKFKALFGPRAA